MSRTLSNIGGLAAITAVLWGCVSHPNSDSTTPIPTLPPQSISSDDITNYARAVLAVEAKRQQIYSEIGSITNQQQVPDITCTKPNTISTLPGNAQKIAIGYCQEAKKSIESNSLTINQFNGITETAKSNQDVQQRIQAQLIRLNQR